MQRISGTTFTLAAALTLASCHLTAGSGSYSSGPGYYGATPAEPQPAQPTGPVVIMPYSPPHYQTFVRRSVPYRSIARKSFAATVPSRLRVREDDLIGDDYYGRKGTIVMLGVEGQAMVGFTTRYSVDIRYPDDDLVRDGVGPADFRESILTLAPRRQPCRVRRELPCSMRYQLMRKPREGMRMDVGNVAFYKTFGDNDAVLLYFPVSLATVLEAAEVIPLGLDEPSRSVAATIRDSTRLLGKDFVLISPESLKLLRTHAGVKSLMATYGPEVVSWAAGLLGANKIVRKLVARGAKYLLMDRRRIKRAIKKRNKPRFGPQDIVEGFALQIDASGNYLLPELFLAEIDYQYSGDVTSFLSQMIGGAAVEMVAFGPEPDQAREGMLFVPNRHINLNYELIRSGRARLRTDEPRALRMFPEFVDAAYEAMNEGVGYTQYWRDDGYYMAELEAARADRAARAARRQ